MTDTLHQGGGMPLSPAEQGQNPFTYSQRRPDDHQGQEKAPEAAATPKLKPSDALSLAMAEMEERLENLVRQEAEISGNLRKTQEQIASIKRVLKGANVLYREFLANEIELIDELEVEGV